MRFGHFYRFSSKLKPFESGSLWFQFCCHFHSRAKSGQIYQLISDFFLSFSSLLMKGKIVRFFNLL
ncbi:hypothetical protein Hanom_Chr03g00239001 [Helianthus anomalus]